MAAGAPGPVGSLWKAIEANKGLIVSVLVVAFPVLIILPLPPSILDFLLIFNITFSILILLTTIYVQGPLQFSVFPSLLLVTTLFRLVLNIATTRLILANANHGEDAAGQVVKTFGTFVAGDNEVVGFVLFAILVIIQFVVITKGATRISEVAARFTLDGMPGKQMAIDADLNAGMISEAEARERRATIAKEADFYGAMDGASKFVRGDAIAGIIIIAINIIGGFVIGVFEHGMSMLEALSVFTRLTIGDGLVSQIPAFVISVASGLLVTRATAQTQLGEELITQIFSRPVTLWIVTGFIGALLVTPLPKAVVAMVGAGCALVAYTVEKRNRGEAVRKDDEDRKKIARTPPKVQALLPIDAMELEIGYALIKIVEAAHGGDLLDRITMIRRQLAQEMGVVVPPIRIRDNMQLAPNQYVIKIRGTAVSKGEAYPGQLLAMDSGATTGKLDGVQTTEPAFGLPAVWVSQAQRARAEALGYTVVDAGSVVATHLTEVVRGSADKLLTRIEVHSLIENVKTANDGRAAKLVDEVVDKVLKIGDIQKVLQNLLRERVSIRDLETILETLGDVGGKTKDTTLLTEYVRIALGRSICQAVQDRGTLHCVTLDPKMEEVLTQALEHAEGGTYLTLPPRTTKGIVAAIAAEVEKLVVAGHPPVVLCSPQIRSQVKRITDHAGHQFTVLSYNEIVTDIRVETTGVAALAG